MTSGSNNNDNTAANVRPPNKADRTKIGKDTIYNVIPKILEESQRARDGISNVTKLKLADIAHSAKVSLQAETYVPPKVNVVQMDTFDAAQDILRKHPQDKVAVLNMCSTMQPGGGVLRGAKAQEESLCLRSTLYPSLHTEYYRMQEDALIYTPDVLVFRSSDNKSLPVKDRYFVDVISCPALRKPQVENNDYVRERDKEVMLQKMRMILRIAVERNVKRLVLGALGCGAYGNPNIIVADMFKRVIFGNLKRREEQEGWQGIEEIVFAIYGKDNNFSVFEEAFQSTDEQATGVDSGGMTS